MRTFVDSDRKISPNDIPPVASMKTVVPSHQCFPQRGSIEWGDLFVYINLYSLTHYWFGISKRRSPHYIGKLLIKGHTCLHMCDFEEDLGHTFSFAPNSCDFCLTVQKQYYIRTCFFFFFFLIPLLLISSFLDLGCLPKDPIECATVDSTTSNFVWSSQYMAIHFTYPYYIYIIKAERLDRVCNNK